MEMFDVLEVNIQSKRVRILARNLDEPNAEAVVNMAVARRGVEEHFFVSAPLGMYNDGDTWKEAGA